jgi:hypothetical protein
MSPATREARTAVMIRVEVSWEDASGNFKTVLARMEDKSLSGACIRLKTPIEVGAKVRVQWRFEQFSGVVRYCRLEDWDYVVGMQRESTSEKPAEGKKNSSSQPVDKTPIDRPEIRGTPPMVRSNLETKVQNAVEEQPPAEAKVLPVAKSPVEDQHPIRDRNRMRQFRGGVRRAPGPEHASTSTSGDAVKEEEEEAKPDFAADRRNEVRTPLRVRAKEVPKEKKSMARKWLGLTPWQKHKKETSNEAGTESTINNAAQLNKESFMPGDVASAGNAADEHKPESVAPFQIEMLPLEEVYRGAGMLNPQKGYSIHKVVDMLNSDHLTGLSKEMRRAAVLMALDAAGISIEDVQRDAKARQDVLDAYEAEQKKQAEAEWARKSQENIQTEEELERVKAHYMARIARNLEGVSREKAVLESWVALKQKEILSIAEVVELCAKPSTVVADTVPAIPTAPLAKAAAAGSDALGVVPTKV